MILNLLNQLILKEDYDCNFLVISIHYVLKL